MRTTRIASLVFSLAALLSVPALGYAQSAEGETEDSEAEPSGELEPVTPNELAPPATSEPASTSPIGQPPPPRPANGGYFVPDRRRSALDNRSGWFLGAGVGLGATAYGGNDTADGSQGGYYFDARFGGMLRPRLAIAVEFLSDGHRQDGDASGFDGARVQNTFGITATYWIRNKLWVRGGLGASNLNIYREGLDTESSEGPTFLAGVGYELLHRGLWAFDVSLRLATSSFNTAFGDSSRTSWSFNLGVTRF